MNKLAPPYKTINDHCADIRHSKNHPLQLTYSEVLRECLLTAKLSDSRTFPNFMISQAPFTLAVKYALQNEASAEEIYTYLKAFYNNFKPQTALEWFNIIDKKADKKLKSEPPWAAIPPWRARSLENYRSTIAKGTLNDNLKNGLHADITVSGWAGCGPVSDEKISIESERLHSVLKSISQHGYKRHNGEDGDIVATALVSERKKWKWVVTNGLHRACVLSALGYSEIPVKINLVIRRSEVDYWPHVASSLYTKKNALSIFDELFNGCSVFQSPTN
ncbi:hypothetical protein [Halomonas sp. DWK9]|uniref:hypothetical protein n=1 Tax=Halomonas sp. DWK9 TaxID=3060155 RepID=UPI00287FD03D|nr:hypothetical protein [Halomonas sp. DWK9]